MVDRYLTPSLEEHLAKFRQMIFVVGPRQVGKTTLAKSFLSEPKPGINYFNWDVAVERRLLVSKIFPGKTLLSGAETERVVFDEIHKYPRWKNSLKGLFDGNEPRTHWIITGSAQLNVFRKGQDSLLGRSFAYHLCPLSVAELAYRPINRKADYKSLKTVRFERPASEIQDVFDSLMRFGGFPEPFLKQDASFVRRWRSSRLERLINQDLASTEHLKNISLIEHLMFLLPERVGSPLSINNLREDLEVHHATAKHWVELLERVFYGFQIRPYMAQRARTLKKEPKWYLWDWSEIEDEGVRFENMVAVHLMKYVFFINDSGLGNLALYYVRDREKREVDFLLCNGRVPMMLIECKAHDTALHAPLGYFAERLKVPRALQLVMQPCDPVSHAWNRHTIEVVSAASFLRELV